MFLCNRLDVFVRRSLDPDNSLVLEYRATINSISIIILVLFANYDNVTVLFLATQAPRTITTGREAGKTHKIGEVNVFR